MADRNKTELTQNITRAAALWLDGKGFKPVETEVGVADGWLADVAGVSCPTQTELIGMKLLRRPPNWTRDGGTAYEAAIREWSRQRDAIPKMISALIEVKVSPGDYRGDRKWEEAVLPANLCYVAMPEGMIDEGRWPRGWGVILFSREGHAVRRVIPPAVHCIASEQQLALVLSLAVARDHVTRYGRLRELQKKVRLSAGERTTVARVSSCLHAILAIMKGTPIESALLSYGIRSRLPDYVVRELEAVAPKIAV